MSYSPQTRKRLTRGVAILTAALFAAICALEFSGSLEWLENRSSDWRAAAAADPSRADPDIVIIDIDNASFRAISADLGRWPWTRRVWTELLNYLAPGGPRMVLFDILFAGEEPAADAGFAAAMRKAGVVALPFAFVSAMDLEMDAKLAPPVKAALDSPARGPELAPSEWTVHAPEAAFLDAAVTAGSNLGNPDADGITRRLPLAIRYEGRDWATLWLAAALKLKGAPKLPLDERGNYVVRWNGTPLTAYKRIPLMEMVCSMQPEICDPAARRHPSSEFAGKIVFVGASAAGSFEVRPTPVSETAPGVFVLATALDNLLHDQGVSRAPAAVTLALILLLGALPGIAVASSRGVTPPLAVTAATLGAYGAACFYFYARSLWLPMAAPMLGVALSFTANTAYRYFAVDRELSRTRGTLERYVSPQLVRYVMDNLDSFRFDGQKRKLTIFFSDVRGFTTLTEKSDPVTLLKQLNEYLEAMTDIIFRYDGIVDKFIGDGIMAHWGAFTPEKPNAELAARASLEMMAKLAELNKKWEAAGLPPLDIGIGLNTAEVIFGNVGAGKKLDFTAIGDGVNLAARLESANKEYKTHIIVSEATLRELGGAARVTPLGSIVVKGKTKAVEIFELHALDGSSAAQAAS